ncbi:hypothetical protein ccbrp13_71270 [Ktedonobacteria bacterium brp13]|nr:hypothetical protein ccbrp13_71270 [Ktedonobacteria bacterium brp13]
MTFARTLLGPLYGLFTSCTVRLEILGKRGGTGFFVAPGLILTCSHVVDLAWQTKSTVDVYKNGQKIADAHIVQFREIQYPDVALLQIPQIDHPCVFLDQEINLGDELYIYGYTPAQPNGDSLTLDYEGPGDSQHPLLKLKKGQALPGMSGSPLLNLRTGKVCGILRSTRDEDTDMGGGAVPILTVLQEFPGLLKMQQQFHQTNTQWLSLLPSPNSYNLTNVMVRQILGPSVQLVQFANLSSASKDRSQLYYEGALLSWDILAANADVLRDTYDDLLRYALLLHDQLHMICLHGEPGAGKSTLAWRLAAEVAQRLQRPLLHIRNNEDAEIWFKLEDFFSHYQIPFVVLVDDLFRERLVSQNLQSLNLDLPLLIISTSRTNELPSGLRLPFEPFLQKVSSPTTNEKAQVLQKLGMNEATLGAEVRKRLQKANSWLVMMLELTTGQDLKKIIHDTIDRLQKHYPILYDAYAYLCFVGQYDLSLPETLLDALDSQGRFYQLLEWPESKGLIISDERQIRTQHSLIAQHAFQVYRRNPLMVAQKLVHAVQIDQNDHCTFLSRLFFQLLKNQQEALVRKLLEQYHEKIHDILSVSSSEDLFYRWRGIYYALNEFDEVLSIERSILSRPPQSSNDVKAHMIFADLREEKARILKVLEDTKQWLEIHPQDTGARQRYVWLVGRHGSKAQIEQMLEDTKRWLEIHPQDTAVHPNYVKLVGQHGSKVQIEQMLEDTKRWLETHPQDTAVRPNYVGLVGQHGSKVQIEQMLEDTRTWLETHPRNTNVRQLYVKLVGQHGSKAQIEQMLEDTRTWLEIHPQDTAVRQNYVGLVGQHGSKAQIEQMLEDTRTWLEAYPQDTYIRQRYVKLVGQHGSKAQIEQMLEDTRTWLETHPRNTNVRPSYVEVVGRHGNREQIELAPTFRRVIDRKPEIG